MKAPVSVLIPARNEAAQLADCLHSVAWADEVIVVDSGSQDETAALATAMGARVEQFTYQPGEMKKKNWALTNLHFANEWILILDADERITPSLAREIAGVVDRGTTHTAFFINRKNYFGRKWIRHAGYYPSWNIRLVRRGRARYELLVGADTQSGDNEVHEHVLVDGTVGRLTHPMDHFAYPTVEHFIEKHNRYSNWEAVLRDQICQQLGNRVAAGGIERSLNLRRKLKRVARRFPFPHWLRFLYHYVLRRGFLDGAEGYIFCHMLAEYEFWIWAKSHLSTEVQTGR